jgi:hypothetical protein
LDIVIEPWPYNTTAAVTRWSSTDQYPQNLNPVFAPGETRTYTWRWLADPAYAPPNFVTASGIRVDMPITASDGRTTPISPLTIGIHYHPSPGGRGMFCADFVR